MSTPAEHQQAIATQLQQSSEAMAEYLARALPVLTDNLATLRSADPEAGVAVLAQAVEGLEWIAEYLSAAQGATADTQPEISAALQSVQQALLGAVSMIVDAMTAKDSALLADLVEFELIENLRACEGVAVQLARGAAH